MLTIYNTKNDINTEKDIVINKLESESDPWRFELLLFSLLVLSLFPLLLPLSLEFDLEEHNFSGLNSK